MPVWKGPLWLPQRGGGVPFGLVLGGFWVAIYVAGSRSVNRVLRGLVLTASVLSVDYAILTQSPR